MFTNKHRMPEQLFQHHSISPRVKIFAKLVSSILFPLVSKAHLHQISYHLFTVKTCLFHCSCMVHSTCPLADSSSPDSAHSSVHLCSLYSPNSVLHVLSFRTAPCQRSTGSKSCYSCRLKTKKHTPR